MDDDRFEAERRRLREEMQAAIEEVRAAYQRRLEAVDRAEGLMRFAASGEQDPGAAGETVPALVPASGSLRGDLARWAAGRTEQFTLADAEARFPGAAPKEIRTCLAQMAKAGTVKIIEAGEAGRSTRYEVPEPDYAAHSPSGLSGQQAK